MNAENLRTLAHELRADPLSYDQETFGTRTECGTVGCIAGHAAALSCGEAVSVSAAPSKVVQAAAQWLGLQDGESRRLFSAWPSCGSACPPGCHGGWPSPFHERFRAASKKGGIESPAMVAGDLLDALADGTVSL